MKDINDLSADAVATEDEGYVHDDSHSHLKFTCPNCGNISRDDVLFLCNTCDSSDLLEKDGVYMCPSCLVPGENFECNLCGSDEVTMRETK